MRDCAWCGLPLEVVREYEQRTPATLMEDLGFLVGGGTTTMAQARCLSGHWYGGPLAVLEEEAGA